MQERGSALLPGSDPGGGALGRPALLAGLRTSCRGSGGMGQGDEPEPGQVGMRKPRGRRLGGQPRGGGKGGDSLGEGGGSGGALGPCCRWQRASPTQAAGKGDSTDSPSRLRDAPATSLKLSRPLHMGV